MSNRAVTFENAFANVEPAQFEGVDVDNDKAALVDVGGHDKDTEDDHTTRSNATDVTMYEDNAFGGGGADEFHDANDDLDGLLGEGRLQVEEGEVQEQGNEWNNITINMVRDGVVAGLTSKMYHGEILKLIRWCQDLKPEWIHPLATQHLAIMFERRNGERVRMYNARVLRQLRLLLRRAKDDPVFNLEAITPEGFMAYIISKRNGRTGRYLSKSAYGNLRAALFHLYRLHNSVGFPEAF